MSKAIIPPRDYTPQQERELVELAFMCGPSALLARGLTQDEIVEFQKRPTVQVALASLLAEYRNEEVLAKRSQFVAARMLREDLTAAAKVLRRALAGPQYQRDVAGVIQRGLSGDPLVFEEVDKMQFQAALEVLDRLGVDGKPAEPSATDVNVSVVFGEQTQVRADLMANDTTMTESQRVVSRERVRVVIDALSDKLPDMAKRVLTDPAVSARSAKLKPKPKPKSARKV